MTEARAVFEEIFDGPDSLFGQLFGPSRAKIREQKRAKAKPVIRVTLDDKQVKDLKAGRQLRFETPGASVVVRPMPKQ